MIYESIHIFFKNLEQRLYNIGLEQKFVAFLALKFLYFTKLV